MWMIGVVTDAIVLWNEEEFHKLRIQLVIYPLFLLVALTVGIATGAMGFCIKMWLMEAVIVAGFLLLVRLFVKRSAFIAESGTLAARIASKDLKTSFLEVVDWYFHTIGWVLAGEIAIGILAIWFSFHRYPAWAILLFLAVIGFAVMPKPHVWFKRVVKGLLVFTVFASLAAMLLPQTSAQVATRAGQIDGALAKVIQDGGLTPAMPTAAVPGAKLVVLILKPNPDNDPQKWVVPDIDLPAGSVACAKSTNNISYYLVVGGGKRFRQPGVTGRDGNCIDIVGTLVFTGADEQSVVQVWRSL